MSASRQPTIKLREDKGQYIKSVGYAETRSQNVRAKTWYLGAAADGKDAAFAKLAEIQRQWQAIDASGRNVWTADEIAALEGPSPQALVAPALPGRKLASNATMKEGAEKWIAELRGRVAAGQIDGKHVDTQEFHCTRLIGMIGNETTWRDFDESRFKKVVLDLCARPLCKPRNNKSVPGRMAVTTVKGHKKTLKALCEWASETDRGDGAAYWSRPLRFSRILKENQPALTDAERRAALEAANGSAEVMTLTIPELAHLFHAGRTCNRREMCGFLLLALNCGFANEEIADLKPWEVHGLNTDQPSIARHRGKTERLDNPGVYARWPLWKETADFLRECGQFTNSNDPVLRSPRTKGRLIVDRSDYVRSTWDNLYDRLWSKPKAETRKLSFKFLRKTAASFIQNDLRYGGEISDAFLSHARQGEIRVYTPRHWELVAEAVMKLREFLEPIFCEEAMDSGTSIAIAN